MSDKDNGGPAFPEVPGADNAYEGRTGMTLRDYFAARAMVALIGAHSEGFDSDEDMATDAYNIADAMLKARSK